MIIMIDIIHIYSFVEKTFVRNIGCCCMLEDRREMNGALE